MQPKAILFRRISELVTLKGAARRHARGPMQEKDLGVIRNGAILAVNGKILWCGSETRLKSAVQRHNLKGRLRQVDCQGRSVLPSLVEPHTHLVFAGDRKDEFAWRTQGVSYQEIGARGGGILTTVKATRRATSTALTELARERLARFLQQGVATVEIKSGYGLSPQSEIKILKVIEELRSPDQPRLVSTVLPLHALPPEAASAEAYVDEVINDLLPMVARHGLASRADLFVERGYFDLRQAERYAQAVFDLGFDLVVHADQLSRQGATRWGARVGARSVDHIVRATSADLRALAASRTTAVLLPTADLYLRLPYPPARTLLDLGGRVALATDFNPGSSPTQDLSLVGVLARVEMGMSLAEVLIAMTLGGAYALGLEDELGSIEPGKACDLTMVKGSWRDLFYAVGFHPISGVWRQGRCLFSSP